MLYIANAFSLNMLKNRVTHLTFTEVGKFDIIDFGAHKEVVSIVGHADTASLFSSILGIEVKCNRASVTLGENDYLLVGQYSGPRLPEGASVLPEGASIKWFYVAPTFPSWEEF